MVKDVTGDEDKYKVDVNGFQFFKHKSRFETQLADLKIRPSVDDELDPPTKEFYKEMAEFLTGVLAQQKS